MNMSRYILTYKRFLGEYSRTLQKNSNISLGKARIKAILECRPILRKENESNIKIEQYKRLFKKVKIEVNTDERFFYFIDEGIVIENKNTVIENLTPNYEYFVDNSIEQIRKKNQMLSNEIANQNLMLIDMIQKYIKRVSDKIKKSKNMPSEKKDTIIRTLERMLTDEANDLKDALQRILFCNQILWQTGHKLIGLGRLDKILERFPIEDDCYEDIKSFLRILHKDYRFKSSEMLGDTGQVIVLGGLEADGSYYVNEYTYLFLRANIELHFPDPKIYLRVADETPEDLLNLAVESIASGLGGPLLSNDNRVIPALLQFGYKEDVYNYAVSACWEPLIPGVSLEQNNLCALDFGKCIYYTIQDPRFVLCDSFVQTMQLFRECIDNELQILIEKIDKIQWEPDPILTLITRNCLEKNRDISAGGAYYNNYGMLSVGISTAVNSLLNIEKFVFERAELTLRQIVEMVMQNYSEHLVFRERLIKNERLFGKDDKKVIEITSSIQGHVEAYLSKYSNRFAGKVKFGLSSPSYISLAAIVPATFDGRYSGEPYATHISCSGNVSPIEIVQFASKLDYNGIRANGNVIDIMLPSVLINNKQQKLLSFIKGSIKQGFYQMQFNVLSYKQLLDAKENPERYPGLIVRVWGFSAYFADLPEEYQNHLIERAKMQEGVS